MKEKSYLLLLATAFQTTVWRNVCRDKKVVC